MQEETPTCRLFVECIPLHFAIPNVRADKVLAIAQEHPISDLHQNMHLMTAMTRLTQQAEDCRLSDTWQRSLQGVAPEAHRVNVRRGEVGYARVAGVLRVARLGFTDQLSPNLRTWGPALMMA